MRFRYLLPDTWGPALYAHLIPMLVPVFLALHTGVHSSRQSLEIIRRIVLGIPILVMDVVAGGDWAEVILIYLAVEKYWRLLPFAMMLVVDPELPTLRVWVAVVFYTFVFYRNSICHTPIIHGCYYLCNLDLLAGSFFIYFLKRDISKDAAQIHLAAQQSSCQAFPFSSCPVASARYEPPGS